VRRKWLTTDVCAHFGLNLALHGRETAIVSGPQVGGEPPPNVDHNWRSARAEISGLGTQVHPGASLIIFTDFGQRILCCDAHLDRLAVSEEDRITAALVDQLESGG